MPLRPVSTPSGANGSAAPCAVGATDDQDDADFGPQPTPSRELPGAAEWGQRLAQVVVEVMSGHRPSTQLLRWASRPVYDEVVAQTEPLPRPGRQLPRQRPVVSGVRVCEPADGVAEVSAVVHRHPRAHAMALRLEGRDGRWQMTALETGCAANR